jgi:hypothetical protein
VPASMSPVGPRLVRTATRGKELLEGQSVMAAATKVRLVRSLLLASTLQHG